VPDEQAVPAFMRQVGERPLRADHNSVAEADQEEDVRDRPRDPGGEAGDVHGPKLRDRLVPSDRRQRAVVPVAECTRRTLPAQAAQDRACHEPALLLGDRRQAGQRLPVTARYQGRIADDRYLGVPRDAQVGANRDPAAMRRGDA